MDELNYEMTSRRRATTAAELFGLWFGDRGGEERAINLEKERERGSGGRLGQKDPVDDNAVAQNGCYHKDRAEGKDHQWSGGISDGHDMGQRGTE